MQHVIDNPLWIVVAITVLGTIFGIGKWVGGINSDRKNLKGVLQGLKNTLGVVQEDVKKLLLAAPSPVIQRRSRLQLTELGQEILGKIEGAEWAKEIASHWKSQVDGMNTYEIQEYCRVTIGNLGVSAARKNILQEVAFEHGLRESQVREVLAIEVRDRLIDLIRDAEDAPEGD